MRQQEEEMEREEREKERKRKEKEKMERLEREKQPKVSEKEREREKDFKFENTESPSSMRLPERMPSELEAMVKDITKVAKEGLGKSKFFLANGKRTVSCFGGSSLPPKHRAPEPV